MERIDAYRLAEQIAERAQVEGESLGLVAKFKPNFYVGADSVSVTVQFQIPEEAADALPSSL